MKYCLLALSFAACLGVAITVEFYGTGECSDCSIVDDDGCSPTISLSPPIRFFGECYSYCTVSANGILEFRHEPSAADCSDILNHVENTTGNHTIIAVFYGDVDVEGVGGGSISYSQPVVTDGNSLERAKQQIQNLTQYKSFEPTYLIVGTWDRVGYYERKNDSVIA
ncbi:hypothetical protein GBAR_LOCUS18776 [Geodia barretti]|uniref:NIDO domain-containing protein n=1 Tax=Geodia barretti TaxID=519541 RepID=A0AA35SQ82_GEOBA|nr:hypothetical protein GBAR_LOCUS18776 [Geodia barretti]